jgi:hypothetical protein
VEPSELIVDSKRLPALGETFVSGSKQLLPTPQNIILFAILKSRNALM